MTKRLKKGLLMFLLAISCIMFGLFCNSLINIDKTAYATNSYRVFNFDTSIFVNKGIAAESDRASAILSTENGYLHMVTPDNFQKTQPDGWFFTYTGENLSSEPVHLGDYSYFKVRFKRVNCGNNQILLYLWDGPNSNPFLCALYIGDKYDNKWIDLTISLTESKAYVRDLETDLEQEYIIDANSSRCLNPQNNLSKLRFNLAKAANPDREAYAEFFGFFTDKQSADEYNGNAEQRLNNAENYLTSNVLRSEFALPENTEDKMLTLVRNFIEDNENIGVQAEIVNYDRYSYPTTTEEGFIYFDVNLYSAGKVAYIENVKLVIDKVPSEPVLYKFDNEEIIEQLHGTAVEKYLYEGVMKVVQPDCHVSDGFWLYFDTTEQFGEKDPFLMQSYSILQWRIKYKGQGPNQFFFNNYNSLYVFGIGYDEEVWLTVQFDTSKSKDALKVLNESTGVISYYDAPNPASYSTDYVPPAFRGMSNIFRFNMGRRGDLERWALVDYFGFFPTVEQADEYGFNHFELINEEGKEDAMKDYIDSVNLSSLNVLKLALKDNFTGKITVTLDCNGTEKKVVCQFNNQKESSFNLEGVQGILKSFSFETENDASVKFDKFAFANASGTESVDFAEVVNSMNFNLNNVLFATQDASNCYTESESRKYAFSVIEKISDSTDTNKKASPDGVKANVVTKNFVKPTRSENGKYEFDVYLKLGENFSVLKKIGSKSFTINKIKYYAEDDEFGSRSTLTDYYFGADGYAISQKSFVNSSIKTVEFTLKYGKDEDALLLGNSEFGIYKSASNQLYIKNNGVEVYNSGKTTLSKTNSQVITVVFGQDNLLVYINAAQKASKNAVVFTEESSKLFIAGSPDSSAYDFSGYITEVKIYNKERSAENIKRYYLDTLYVSESAEEQSLDGLVAYWRIKDANQGFTNRVDYDNPLIYTSHYFYNGYYHEFTGEDWLESKAVLNGQAKTVEMWTKTGAKDSGTSVLFSAGNFAVGVSEEGKLFVEDGENTLVSTSIIRDERYHHIAVTVDSSVVKLYIDGVLDLQFNQSINCQINAKIFLGGKSGYDSALSRNQATDTLVGRIADFRIYNTVRNVEEIAFDIENRSSIESQTGVIFYAPLDISRNLVFGEKVSANDLTITTWGLYKIINEDTSSYFSFVALPDPQDYVVASTDRNNGTWVSYDAWRFYNMNLTINNWIIDNKAKENIQAILTVGDLTQYATEIHFSIFEEAMNVLDGCLPYTLVLGNHDYESMLGFGSSTRNHQPFIDVFDFDEWSSKSFYGGSFAEGDMDNSYYLFDIDGRKIMIMCLEFYPRDEVLEWFDYIAKKYSDYEIIVTSHSYISGGQFISDLCGYGLASLEGASANNGIEMFDKLITQNSNIIQGINGHVGNSSFFACENEYGDTVMNASFDTWGDTINKKSYTDGLIHILRYYDDGTMGIYLYDAVEQCYFATNYRWEADMSEPRGE